MEFWAISFAKKFLLFVDFFCTICIEQKIVKIKNILFRFKTIIIKFARLEKKNFIKPPPQKKILKINLISLNNTNELVLFHIKIQERNDLVVLKILIC